MTEKEIKNTASGMIWFLDGKLAELGLHVADYPKRCSGLTYSSWYGCLRRESITLRSLLKVADAVGYEVRLVEKGR